MTWQTTDPHGTSLVTENPTTGATTTRLMDPFGDPRGAGVSWPSNRGFLNDHLGPFSSISMATACINVGPDGSFAPSVTFEGNAGASLFIGREPSISVSNAKTVTGNDGLFKTNGGIVALLSTEHATGGGVSQYTIGGGGGISYYWGRSDTFMPFVLKGDE